MAQVDHQTPEPTEVLVRRAAAGVARRAAKMLGGAFGHKVVVVAGKGNNGADGRTAGALLEARGAHVLVLEAGDLAPSEPLPPADLVIDAAYGTGLQRAYSPPSPGATPVLAVDIPSGLSGLVGQVPEGGGALKAAATVTFAALKPGLLFGAGPDLAGEVELVDIGLGALVGARCRCWLVEDSDVMRLVPARGREAHKWQTAVHVVAGSPGMTGAPWLASRGALRSGAGYVRLSMPGVPPSALPPSELVHVPVGPKAWHEAVLAGISRVKALVVGPGLGPLGLGPLGQGAGGGRTGAQLTQGDMNAAVELPGGEVGLLLGGAPVPAVVDADALNAIGSLDALATITARREAPTVITPHEGELGRLAGQPVGPDRLAAAREAAARSGAIVLLKGPTTVVARPDGRAFLANSGDPRLATAGTGDVLSGVIGAFIARGVPAFEAAALGAHVHGRAARNGYREGLAAGDLPDLVAAWLSATRA
jgi:NAD(P)H-hydrate repair Nnr-like enzyme with NAD(P)H-hydrate dehydratase domain/NAD(P)H-hydrate repair Nnr-like enzyme with NAD(P)H-hydrate epimerase domain